MKATNTIFDVETASLKITTPKIDVPAIPMPVHTAQATDSGNFFNAIDRNKKLKIIPATVNILGNIFVKPWVNFKPIAQDTSKSPAKNNTIQLFK